jgi:hypothetical protein
MTITTRTGVKFQTTSESRQLGTGDNNQPHITLGWQIHVENQVIEKGVVEEAWR